MRRLDSALLAACALAVAISLGCSGDAGDPNGSDGEALRIGLLLDFSESTERSEERRRSFELAIQHINAAGGVMGQPVEWAQADSTRDPETAARAAKQLVDQDGIHALVGPSTSANSLRVISDVIEPTGIPAISPSATSPALTAAVDRDFFFRTALSDVAQGPVLAQMTHERGYRSVAVIYRDDAWGRGLLRSFADAWTGELGSVALEPDKAEFAQEIAALVAMEAEALVIIAFDESTQAILSQVLSEGLFDQIALAETDLSDEAIAELEEGFTGRIFGTQPASRPGDLSSQFFEESYEASYGELPQAAYVAGIYDATIAIALAAQAAGSLDGAAIRDKLRSVGAAPGLRVVAGPDGIAKAMSALSEGEEIDYDGAAASMDWDDSGDLTRGQIGTWKYTPGVGIEDTGIASFGEDS